MDRLSELDASQSHIDDLRADQHAAALPPRSEDDDLTDRIDASGAATTDPSGILADRRDRTVTAYYEQSSGLWKPTLLKPNDDADCGGWYVRVVGPARDRAFFLGYYGPWFGDMLIPIEARYLYDRAPADANETAMPIVPPDPPAQFAGQQQQQPQPKARDTRPKSREEALRAILKSMPHDIEKRVREALKRHAPHLLTGHG